MVNFQPLLSTPDQRFEIVHSQVESEQIAEGRLLLPILRPLESHLVGRKLLPDICRSGGQPLWFTAITEQNNYLWRTGRSLADHKLFSFWIDLDALIEQRLNQLTEIESGGICPIGSPLDAPLKDYSWIEAERQYLKDYQRILTSISRTAHMLSKVALEIEQDLTENQPAKQRVLLPRTPSCSI